MKHLTPLFICFVVCLLTACAGMTENDVTNDDNPVSVTVLTKSNSDDSFSFDPITQDSLWRFNENTAERIAALQIPVERLDNLSTENLVRLCMEYPFFIHFMAYNTPEEGIRVVKSRFNGFRELESRQDAAQKLLSYYEQVDVAAIVQDALRGTRGTMTIPRLTYVEHILQSMTPLFSKDEMRQLNALASAKESVKLSYPDVFSENSRNVLFKQEMTRVGDSIVLKELWIGW